MATATQTVKSAAKSANGTSSDDVRADLAELKKDFAQLSSDIAALAKSGVSNGIDRATNLGESVKARADDATEALKAQAVERRDQLNDTVRRHPLAAIGIAAGVGFLLSRVARR